MKRWLFRGTVVVFMLLILMEATLRLFGSSVGQCHRLVDHVYIGPGSTFEPHPTTGWDTPHGLRFADLHKPDSRNPKKQAYLNRLSERLHADRQDRISNNFGMHQADDITAAIPDNTFRILCIGSSTTWGQTVEGSWPALLQQRLEADSNGLRIEVLNAGVGTFSSRQVLLKFRDTLQPIQADLVIFMNAWNDAAQGWGHDRDAFSQTPIVCAQHTDPSPIWIVQWVRRRTTHCAVAGSGPRSTVEEYQDNLRTIAQIATERGMKMIVCSEPSALSIVHGAAKQRYAQSGHTPESQTLYNTAARDMATELKIPFANPARAFNEEELATDYLDPQFDPIHPIPKGNRFIADQIVDTLRQASTGYWPGR